MNISKKKFNKAVIAACLTVSEKPAPRWYRDNVVAPKLRAAFAAVGIQVGKEAQP